MNEGSTTVARKMETLATPPGECVPRIIIASSQAPRPIQHRLMFSMNRYTTFNLLLKLDMRILTKISETHASIIRSFAERLPDRKIAVYFVVHPFPACFGRNSAACAGNIMGVENIEDDCILLQASLATDNLHRPAYVSTFKEGLDELEAFAQSIEQ